MAEGITAATTSDQNGAASASSASSGYDAIDNEPAMESETSTSGQSPPKEYSLWRKPWYIAFVVFLIFYFIWFQGAIIQRYWVDEDFGKALPGLDKT